MIYEFKMPVLGAEMEAGRLVEWRVKPGDHVKRGDVIAVVDTDKAAVEVEVWETGTVERFLVEPGTRVPVGTAIATIAVSGEVRKPLPSSLPVAPSVMAGPPASRPAMGVKKAEAVSARARISPAARKRAAELGIDLSAIQGTGPQGAITSTDIERRAAVKPAMRGAIAAAMARSKREIPHYYLGTQIDVSRSLDWLTAGNLKRSVTERILFPVVLLKAVALALKKVPELNGFFKDGAFQPSEAIHLGVAISLRGGGLIAPALHDADKKNLGELMHELQDLVNRVRSGVLRGSELSDSTITVTNLGEQGVETIFGVIYPPQVAIVGFGSVVTRPSVSDGKVSVSRVIMASLSGDHRVSDGHRGAMFLSELGRILQEPAHL